MERSIFAFIWKYSRKEQFILLAFTVLTFPFLYATLELPKRIINDAIGAKDKMVRVLDFEMMQTQFLLLLCLAYLAAVLTHGLLKMRLNTMKGVLSERMLRRFRYQLISRMMRFPRRYYQTTSQGELVSMVTSEAEPMGGLMGDAVAQPVFQAGQMAIIVIFLFLQSFWFGLAGVALIPLQAWLIPRLQRQINVLNKARIQEVRHLSSEIGETAAGIVDLRTNGGWRYRLSVFTDRLGRLFQIRFQIYQKKFFMKFINNFITQLTPFFFYLVGGYLAIRGDITVGALVAALAAYKDLSNPWKELLTYYNQTQDMALRWDVVTERFAPSDMIDETLFEGTPDEIPHLIGPIALQNVTVRDDSGVNILDDVTIDIPRGAQVAIKASSQAERTALAELLTREIIPTRGIVTMGGHDLSGLHQAVIAARIGYAQAQPYVFSGTLGDNLFMPLRTSPRAVESVPNPNDIDGMEARRAGNSVDRLGADWLDPELAGLSTREEVTGWWFDLVKAMGVDDGILRRMVTLPMDVDSRGALASRIVALRGEVRERLEAEGLEDAIHHFDPEAFNPALPLGGNLLFAAPKRAITQQGLATEGAFLAMIGEQGLAEQGIAISQTIIETLHQTFGMDGTTHPLFTALGIDESLYERLVDVSARRREKGDGALSSEEFSLLLTVPFAFTAEQIGPDFPESFKDEILAIRRINGPRLREAAKDLFVPIAPDTYLPRLTVLENLIYGRVSMFAGLRTELVIDVVCDILKAHNLHRDVATNFLDTPTGIGGTNLPATLRERLGFNRAGIKRPDVMVLNQSLPSIGAQEHEAVRNRLRSLMPDTTQIFIDDTFDHPGSFDLFIEISDGRIDGVEQSEDYRAAKDGSGDLRRKLQIIQRTELFRDLDPRNQRLLAFAARWYNVPAEMRIFSTAEPADSAYLCVSGKAELSYTQPEGEEYHVSTVEPGRLIGDLALILAEPRQLNLTTLEESVFLRIGADQFNAVIKNDKSVLLSLLRAVARNLSGASEHFIQIRTSLPREGISTMPQDGGS